MMKNVLAGIAVRDLSAARVFYTNLVGRPPDLEPMPILLEWKFPEGGVLQVFSDEAGERAGKSSVTLVVADLQVEKARLNLPGLESHNDRVDTLIVHDSEGNQIVLAQPKSDQVSQ